MSTNYIPLDALAGHPINHVGGKALNLGKLTTADFPVPPGIVIPVETYERHIHKKKIRDQLTLFLDKIDYTNEESIKVQSELIKDLITQHPLPKTFIQEITKALGDIDKQTLWAVRSSATAEDLPEASFAGQQDTFLNIPLNDIPEHIKSCWASYWNQRAITYRHNNTINHTNGGIAVVIQRMVDSDASGLIFTNDPRNKREDTIILESAYGLGEAIVSGMVTPDQFAIDKNTGEIIKQNINKKEIQMKLRPGENIVESVPEDDQEKPSINMAQIHALTALGKQIETHFGCSQDIEWSIENDTIYILQSRPITTIQEQDDVIWTRAYGDEYWADVTSPLFASLLGRYLADIVVMEGASIMGYKEILGKQLIRIHKCHAYFNCDVLSTVFSYYPTFIRSKEILNYFPVKDQEAIRNAKPPMSKTIMSQIRSALLDPDSIILRTNNAYLKWSKRFLEDMKENFDGKDISSLTDEQLHETFLHMERAYMKHYKLIRYGMVSHSIATNLLVKKLLSDWLDDTKGILYAKLISGLSGNKTLETNIAVADLTKTAKKHDVIRKSLEHDSPKAFLKKVESDENFKPFKEHLEHFLRDYGQRSHTREIYFPRWQDEPELVVTILKSLMDTPDLDLKALERNKRKERLDAQKDIEKRIKKLPLGHLKNYGFKKILNFAQTYLIFRENQRFFLDHQLSRQRILFTEYGRRFAEKNIIDEPTDIFFFGKEEIFAIADGDKTIEKDIIRKRRNDFLRYKNILPPKFVKGKTEFDDTIIHSPDATQITGVGSSPGVTTGALRIIRSIDDLGTIKEGEILVTSNTDPGWTPVFSKLVGLITETGGILSHGAVVSREYGIPAITAVKNATILLKTGQNVTIDGNDGIIYLSRPTTTKKGVKTQ